MMSFALVPLAWGLYERRYEYVPPAYTFLMSAPGSFSPSYVPSDHSPSLFTCTRFPRPVMPATGICTLTYAPAYAKLGVSLSRSRSFMASLSLSFANAPCVATLLLLYGLSGSPEYPSTVPSTSLVLWKEMTLWSVLLKLESSVEFILSLPSKVIVGTSM